MIFRPANEIRLFRAKLKRCLNFLIRNFKCQDADLKKRKNLEEMDFSGVLNV